jgi:Reverse transcriptase (RNA-dependent DNA polymerase)
VLARRNRIGGNALDFRDRHGNPFIDDVDDVDDSNDEDYDPNEDEHPDDEHPDDDDYDDDDYADADDDDDGDDGDGNDNQPVNVYDIPIAGVYLNNNDDNNDGVNPNEDDDEDQIEVLQNEPVNENIVNENIVEILDNAVEDELMVDPDLPPMADEEENEEEIENDMNIRYGPRTENYDLRPRRPRDYGHLHATLESTTMTQYSMKKGIQMFGKKGTDAVLKELKQLHDKETFNPVDPETIGPEDRRGALPCLMYLTEKRNGTIKGRGCADGRKQRLYTAKEDASSPTVAIESVMLSCVIDAAEKRDVATVDIPGAFLHADMEDKVLMKLEGTMAELLVLLDPELYKKFVQTRNNKTVLYVELKKALYGTLKAALLFWKLLSQELKNMGFEVNPYDVCVMNKMINGKQCTILWHVDDLKISHVEAEVVTEIISKIEAIFGSLDAPVTKTRGKVHDYLGMTIDFSKNGAVEFTMIDYIKKMLETLPEDMAGEAATPAANHLFEVHPESESMQLDKETGDLFHTNVAKLLFLCKRARPDIQTAVAFLCTRVKAPDSDDYKKLARVMKYLRGTVNMPLTLEATNVQIIKWWVDVSFAVHPDMKSHTGGAMTLGKGAIYGTSTRQKLNTKSSTEAELVGVNDVMPQILWTRYFLEAQGYDIKDSIIYQDNQSSILLEKNGRASSGKRTRHINIRYFFVTDRIASNEVSIEYCPTGNMISDYFTKPLQGTPFKKLRDYIMNLPDCDLEDKSPQDHRSVLKVMSSNGTERETFSTSTNPGTSSRPVRRHYGTEGDDIVELDTLVTGKVVSSTELGTHAPGSKEYSHDRENITGDGFTLVERTKKKANRIVGTSTCTSTCTSKSTRGTKGKTVPLTGKLGNSSE